MNRYMKPYVTLAWLLSAALVAGPAIAHCGSCPDDCPLNDKTKHNTLTDQEAEQGWVLLFDGESLEHWRGYRMEDVPSGWVVEDGCIVRKDQDSWKDLITREQYDDFELSLEWKISEGGNSGIFFNVVEDHNHAWDSGPEMQVLDNAKHNDGKNTKTSAGSNYALHAPSKDVTKPAGEFNHAVIRVVGNHVEHHLNGEKIVEYELNSDEWKALVEASKFKDMPHYAKSPVGHIVLQDHGDLVWYRNVKIRPLNSQTETEESNGSSASE